MSKKQSFVLLEVLIAFALVSTAILPFFRYPFQHMQKELTMLFEMELEHIAQNKLAKLHEQFFNQEFAEGLIFSKNTQTVPYENNLISVELSPTIQRKYEEQVFVLCKNRKISQDQKLISLIHFEIKYRKPRSRRILLQAESEGVAQKALEG